MPDYKKLYQNLMKKYRTASSRLSSLGKQNAALQREYDYLYKTPYQAPEVSAAKSALTRMGVGPRTSMYANMISRAYGNAAERAFKEREAVRQFNESLMQRWWELQNAAMLGQAQIAGSFYDDKGRYQLSYTAPRIPQSVINMYRRGPYRPSIYPYYIGDPSSDIKSKPGILPGFEPKIEKTMAMRNYEEAVRAREEANALRRAELNLMRERLNYERSKAEEEENKLDFLARLNRAYEIASSAFYVPVDPKTQQPQPDKAIRLKSAGETLKEIKAATGLDLPEIIRGRRKGKYGDFEYSQAAGLYEFIRDKTGSTTIRLYETGFDSSSLPKEAREKLKSLLMSDPEVDKDEAELLVTKGFGPGKWRPRIAYHINNVMSSYLAGAGQDRVPGTQFGLASTDKALVERVSRLDKPTRELLEFVDRDYKLKKSIMDLTYGTNFTGTRKFYADLPGLTYTYQNFDSDPSLLKFWKDSIKRLDDRRIATLYSNADEMLANNPKALKELKNEFMERFKRASKHPVSGFPILQAASRDFNRR